MTPNEIPSLCTFGLFRNVGVNLFGVDLSIPYVVPAPLSGLDVGANRARLAKKLILKHSKISAAKFQKYATVDRHILAAALPPVFFMLTGTHHPDGFSAVTLFLFFHIPWYSVSTLS